MQADTFFSGGKGHKVCQDYARSGKKGDGRVYALLSDGCSSSPDTDVGARLLVLSAARAIEIAGNWSRKEYVRPREIIQNAERYVIPPLSSSCLDATLLMIRESFSGVTVQVAGDGLIVARDRKGYYEVFDLDFSGAPAYLSYLLNDERRQEYLRQGYGKLTVHRLREEGGRNFVREEYPFTTGPEVFRFEATFDSFDLVMILTDGVHSFHTAQTLKPIPPLQVIERLMDFKSLTGEFVTRRVRKFLTKECPKLGWVHYDDLGVAAVHLDSPSWKEEE